MARDLPGIVGDVALELAGLAETALQLQAQIGPAAAHRTPIMALQSLDVLTQSLSGLADFLSTLAGDLPGGCRPDLTRALGRLRLSAMANRLGGLGREDDMCCEGELELFGAESE